MAQMVPTGMEACGSARSPDRLEPAMIPATKLVLEKRRYKEGVLVVLQVFTFILFFNILKFTFISSLCDVLSESFIKTLLNCKK